MICEWQQGLQQAPVAAHPINNNNNNNNIHTPKLSSVINLSIPESSHTRVEMTGEFCFLDNKKNVGYQATLAKYHFQYSISKLALVSVSTQDTSYCITLCKHGEFLIKDIF